MSQFQIGDTVSIGPETEPVEGIVTGVMFEGGGVSYRVAWWDAGDRCSQWLEPVELRAVE